MKKHLYFVEVGVLMDETNEDFNSYKIMGFHEELAFYDENKLTFLTKQEAMDYATDYITRGVEKTYAILYNCICNIEEKELQEIKDSLYCEHSLDMPIETITDFYYKKNNEIIKGELTKWKKWHKKKQFCNT